jgi:hypothetical protein
MIDPLITTTVRVGELPPAPFVLTDNIPHEIGTELHKGTVQQLADVIGDYLGGVGGLAFNPNTVQDGGTFPATTFNEFMLVGVGTFHNVGGQPDIITTEELNVVTSNGAYWSLAVQIPINVELAGITQNIRSGYLQTTPSEDAIFKALALKANISDTPISVPKIQFVANGTQNTFNIGVLANITAVFWNGALLNDNDWTQSGTNFTLTFIPSLGELIKPI